MNHLSTFVRTFSIHYVRWRSQTTFTRGGGRWSKKLTLWKLYMYLRKCKRRGVGGQKTSLKIGRDCEHMTSFGISSKWLLFFQIVFLSFLSLLSIFLTFLVLYFSYSILSLFLTFLIPFFPYSFLLYPFPLKLDKSKLVLNNAVNLHQTKVDKSKLVWNNPSNS